MTVATVSQTPQPRPKASAGRPIDTAVAQFELAFELLEGLKDDREAFEHIFHGLQRLRALSIKLEDQAKERFRKIYDRLEPEARRLLTACDETLTISTIERRCAEKAREKARNAGSAR